MADRISGRRALANTFFLTMNTVVFTMIGVLWTRNPGSGTWVLVFPLIVLVTQCFTWFWIIRSYRQLNTAKFAVIGAIEAQLPLSPYWRAEWTALGEGRDPARYWCAHPHRGGGSALARIHVHGRLRCCADRTTCADMAATRCGSPSSGLNRQEAGSHSDAELVKDFGNMAQLTAGGQRVDEPEAQLDWTAAHVAQTEHRGGATRNDPATSRRRTAEHVDFIVECASVVGRRRDVRNPSSERRHRALDFALRCRANLAGQGQIVEPDSESAIPSRSDGRRRSTSSC